MLSRRVLTSWALVTVLLAASAWAQSDDDLHPQPINAYAMKLSSNRVPLGEAVTVYWSGAQSHPSDWQDWDWVAGYQVGACNSTSFVGEDTCYGTNQWAWVSSNGGDSGGWQYLFDGPGFYEFRISYCGCDMCNDVTGDIAACDSYQQVAVSPRLEVLPPFDLSPYSGTVQFVLGMLWVEFEASMSSMNSLLSKPAAEPSCSSCLCEIAGLYRDVSGAVDDFRSLWHSFSMVQMENTIGGVVSAVEGTESALQACDVDEIVGSELVEEIMEAAAGLVEGLEVVEMVVKMAIEGENIYSFASNALLGWEQGNYFASGVNTAKLLNILLSTTDLKDEAKRAEILAMAADAGTTQVARRPAGTWVPCDAVPARHTAICFDISQGHIRGAAHKK